MSAARNAFRSERCVRAATGMAGHRPDRFAAAARHAGSADPEPAEYRCRCAAPRTTLRHRCHGTSGGLRVRLRAGRGRRVSLRHGGDGDRVQPWSDGRPACDRRMADVEGCAVYVRHNRAGAHRGRAMACDCVEACLLTSARLRKLPPSGWFICPARLPAERQCARSLRHAFPAGNVRRPGADRTSPGDTSPPMRAPIPA